MSTQATAETLFIEAAGTKFAYRIIGSRTPANANTPPLLLLNHFRSTIDLWDPLLIDTLVSNGTQVITYDYAGIGHSSGEVKLTIKEFGSDLVNFLLALLLILPGNLTHVDILGFSIGGYVAQQTVLQRPDLVRKLILAGTGPSGSLGDVPHRRPMPSVQSAIMAPIPDRDNTIDAFFPSFIARADGLAWFNRSVSARGGPGSPGFEFFVTDPTALANLTQAYLSWDADSLPYALLQTIQSDVLVTAGQNDLIVDTVNSFELARQIPKAKFLMFPGSGHGHLFQYAEFYAREVVAFLQGGLPVPPASAGTIGPVES
ncbi:Alpha/Beta hydrolase protein [Apodospora peruviana]|uniref:Alpha/Beta hydrolase protein n=1 Tax=Apodospora peruviana TaxID=516989 RepID=A0AAE0M889_9PEZI|nr:Alpha/Beta hydrolase protein [Apodospora peruviana]